MESGGDITELPEGCIAKALSFTSPSDACRLSVVSSRFMSAAESDVVWERFLPEDYKSIISNSSDPSLLTRYHSKKSLFLSLCDNPILIDGGKKSFSLAKRSGKKCYIFSARDLLIVWGDTPTYWRWIPEPTSRFPHVAELLDVCWLDICGKIDTSMLSTSTQYAAYLVFKLTAQSYGFEEQQIDVAVTLVGGEGSERKVYFNTQRWRGRRNPYRERLRPRFLRAHLLAMSQSVPSVQASGNCPKRREDGWLEVELGELFINEGQSGELEVRVFEIHRLHWKSGLIVEGIEVRAKEDIDIV